METTREPYELLVRWVPAGAESQYAGTVQAQINFAFVVRDGETVVSWTPDPKGPFHVALTGADGIPLADIIPSLNAASLASLSQKTAELSALAIEKDTALSAEREQKADALNAAQQALTTLAAAKKQITDLEAQITALRADPPPGIAPVSRMQALLALHDAGLLNAVNAIIAQADGRTRLAWETATTFHRSSPTIGALWAALGKTDAELDALFETARQIEV